MNMKDKDSSPLGRDADTRLPDGYAYVYPANGGGETIRVGSNGREINGSTPIRAIPYYFDHPKQPVEPAASVPDMIQISECLPPDGELCIVYWPEGDEGRYEFDYCEEGIWYIHSEHYDHFLSVGKGDIDCPITGPSEQAPYTHWSPLPKPTNPEGAAP